MTHLKYASISYYLPKNGEIDNGVGDGEMEIHTPEALYNRNQWVVGNNGDYNFFGHTQRMANYSNEHDVVGADLESGEESSGEYYTLLDDEEIDMVHANARVIIQH